MVMSKLLLEYKDDLLKELIYKQLERLLLAVSKYNTLPVGIIQFLVSKINLQPTIVLSVYDDKKFVSSLCKPNVILSQSIANSLPDIVNPSVLIFPTIIDYGDIIFNYSQRYYYSSAYIIDFKLMKEGLKKNIIDRYALYTTSERSHVMCNLELTSDIGIIKLPEIQNISIKLPFRNFIKSNPFYEGIIKSIMEEKQITPPKDDIENIFIIIKDSQSYMYNGIHLFKDFFKQKPDSLIIYHSLDDTLETPVRSVCLKMEYNTKLTHMVFYRYIDGVVNNILGTIDEVKHE
jgi:hypothetical protein